MVSATPPPAALAMPISYRVALVCGFAPLLLGVGIFATWLLMRWEWLMAAGAYTLIVGVIAVVIGGIALWVAFVRADGLGLPRRQIWQRTVLGALLLLSNFPVAAGVMLAVLRLETRYVVVVHNDSAQPLEEVRIHGGGVEQRLASVPAGGRAECGLWFRVDGQLEFEAKHGGVARQQVVDDYVTSSLGGRNVVTVRADGTITAARQPR